MSPISCLNFLKTYLQTYLPTYIQTYISSPKCFVATPKHKNINWAIHTENMDWTGGEPCSKHLIKNLCVPGENFVFRKHAPRTPNFFQLWSKSMINPVVVLKSTCHNNNSIRFRDVVCGYEMIWLLRCLNSSSPGNMEASLPNKN